jgi:hypothetical protein
MKFDLDRKIDADGVVGVEKCQKGVGYEELERDIGYEEE